MTGHPAIVQPSPALLALRQQRVALSEEADRLFAAWERYRGWVKRNGPDAASDTPRAAYLSADLAYLRAASAERDQAAREGSPDHFGPPGPARSWEGVTLPERPYHK
jgi:hypothetical protein